MTDQEICEWIIAYDLGFLSREQMFDTLCVWDYAEAVEVRCRYGFGSLRDNYHAALMPMIYLRSLGGKENIPLRAFSVENIIDSQKEEEDRLLGRNREAEKEAIEEVLSMPPIVLGGDDGRETGSVSVQIGS